MKFFGLFIQPLIVVKAGKVAVYCVNISMNVNAKSPVP